ncbi:hypothetical protein [Herbaspirillum sp. YR522]|uniref:hypothetical protein n=1 Tax=Herbaspirillum sp. YR522 TaxID=1144342 RepID=UPI00026F6E44|nr:hypothetical protein [Herbaspirillum sp. YR522]EJM97062.1 hypothetical protein PMI40_04481 [Herbaspirillum sp. YR522]
MKARHILISTLFLGMTAGAMAQSAPATTTGTPSNDPFVQKRQADADAKAEYKDQKKSAKSEYKADKKAAKQQLKQERKESRAARNEQLANTPATKTDKTP